MRSLTPAMPLFVRFPALAMIFLLASWTHPDATAAHAISTNFSPVAAIFEKHCLDCHGNQDPEGKLVLETYETLLKGGESGAAIVAGQSAESLLVKMIEGRIEKDGKKKIMPPGKRKKLEVEEIAAIKGWIDAGAAPPTNTVSRQLVYSRIPPKGTPRKPVTAVAASSDGRIIAIARDDQVELQSFDKRTTIRSLEGHTGVVNALVFSMDGRQLFVGAGIAGVSGEVRVWDVAAGTLSRTIFGHSDAIYSLALAPDGKTLATGSYDQKIKLWNLTDGTELRTLSGHNGAVYGLAFRPDGKILASASADRTVKLWDVASGERRDTLSQALKELYTVAFSPDGKRLVAGGIDNRLRVWEISEKAAETTNPLLYSRFGHEGAILKLAYSPNGKSLLSSASDRTVKLWEANEIKEKLLMDKQPDWPPALAFISNRAFMVGRLDGTVEIYETTSGKPLPPAKPELVSLEPRGVQRGVETTLKITGSNLLAVTEVRFQDPKLKGKLLNSTNDTPSSLLISIMSPSDLAPGPYELSLVSKGGESGRLKLYIDNLPQLSANSNTNQPVAITNVPISIWGVLDRTGEMDEFEFIVSMPETWVFDLNARTIGSKANAVLTLSDESGKVLSSNNDFDGTDPFLAYAFTAPGRYRLKVNDLTLGSSKESFYRLSAGPLPYVTGFFPLSVAAHATTDVELIGHNLGTNHSLRFKSEAPGETPLLIDSSHLRTRKQFKMLVGNGSESLEHEPNDLPDQANPIKIPCVVNGRLLASGTLPDSDIYRFDAKTGQTWIIETSAAQRGSPADTRIELLSPDGQPVERVQLQAVRNSAVTFRGIDSTTSDCRVENWEEMELNEYLYLQGEVVKIFRMPQGPDSGFLFYTSAGKRHAFFDTTSTAHALDEPCYVVDPHPPGAKLVANGLPVFHIPYANDDDGERKLGSDSRLFFTPPQNGSYLVRVTDARGYSGERFAYRLIVREAHPDFTVTLSPANPTVNPGSGQSFTVTADRIDGFDGDIRVEITDLPAGFTASSPLVIQAGHSEAKGTLNAAADAPPPATNGAKVTAAAAIADKTIQKNVNNFGMIKLGKEPKLFVALESPALHTNTNHAAISTNASLELTIAPGQTIPAWLKVKRNGHEDLITFTVENLPHGVIVDNIGLNGVLIPKGQNEREIFLTAAKWVPETDRPCFAIENQAGRQTSVPVLLHVRKPGSKIAAK